MHENSTLQVRQPTKEEPLRIMMSACLLGISVMYDGREFGLYPLLKKIIESPLTKVVHFCPEDYSFGTPRNLPDIHGGNGYDVLLGRARVLTDKGEDWTEGIVTAAHKMLELARENRVELCIMLDISGTCGSSVIYDGSRLIEDKKYQKGPGVAAALLMENGFSVIAQRDFASLEYLKTLLDSEYVADPKALDHHQTPWYQEYFNK